MLSCRQATRLVSTSLDRPLTFWERVILHGHMVICVACRMYRRQVQRLDAAFKAHFRRERAEAEAADESLDPTKASLPGGPRLPGPVRERIKAALREKHL